MSVVALTHPVAGRRLAEGELDLAGDVRAGLRKRGQKELPSKYLYDEMGSLLFEAICLLPEYGLSRAGTRLLNGHARELVEMLRSPVRVAELGSGSGKKTRLLLTALAEAQPGTVSYYPIDLSGSALRQCERELAEVASVACLGVQRSYLDGLVEVAARRLPGEQLLVLFLGSSIGNFHRAAGDVFLGQVRRLLQRGDRFLLATDLVKPIPQMLLAYDDPAGVTAAFNLNLLARLDRELKARFDLRTFRHLARWNPTDRRIEMHLQSCVAQRIEIPGAELTVALDLDETIWTESSHKYTCAEVVDMGARAGFRRTAQWVDHEWPYAHTLFVAD